MSRDAAPFDKILFFRTRAYIPEARSRCVSAIYYIIISKTYMRRNQR